MYTLYVYTYTIDPYCTYGLKRPGCILFKKLVIFYSTLRHHCDRFRNGCIKWMEDNPNSQRQFSPETM